MTSYAVYTFVLVLIPILMLMLARRTMSIDLVNPNMIFVILSGTCDCHLPCLSNNLNRNEGHILKIEIFASWYWQEGIEGKFSGHLVQGQFSLLSQLALIYVVLYGKHVFIILHKIVSTINIVHIYKLAKMDSRHREATK